MPRRIVPIEAERERLGRERLLIVNVHGDADRIRIHLGKNDVGDVPARIDRLAR
jgi:hypothetical protein